MSVPVTHREKIAAVDAMVGSWAFQNVLKPEIDRLLAEGLAQCSNLRETQSVRDGGAGAKNVLEKLLDYPSAYNRAQESKMKQEKKATSPKRASKPLH